MFVHIFFLIQKIIVGKLILDFWFENDNFLSQKFNSISGNGLVLWPVHQHQSMFICIHFIISFSKQKCMDYFKRFSILVIWHYLVLHWVSCVVCFLFCFFEFFLKQKFSFQSHTGTFGYMGTKSFVRKIYSTVKIDWFFWNQKFTDLFAAAYDDNDDGQISLYYYFFCLFQTPKHKLYIRMTFTHTHTHTLQKKFEKTNQQTLYTCRVYYSCQI